MAGKIRERTLRDEIRDSGETPSERPVDDSLDEHGYLAREFLSWLVYHADVEGGGFSGAGDVRPFTIQLGGRVALRTLSGFVSDVTLKGSSPGASPELRYALAGGLAVKETELRLSLDGVLDPHGDERAYAFGLAADGFDLKRVQLPALLTEEDDDRAEERMALLAELDAALEHAFAFFVALRGRPSWKRTVVPAMRAWLTDGT